MDTLRNQIIERKAIELITSAAEFTESPFEAKRESTYAIDLTLAGPSVTGSDPEAARRRRRADPGSIDTASSRLLSRLSRRQNSPQTE